MPKSSSATDTPISRQAVQHLRGSHDVLHRAGLQHLQFQVARLYPGMRRKPRPRRSAKSGCCNSAAPTFTLTGSSKPSGLPRFHLRERSLDHPFAQLDRQRVVLNHGQEHPRRQQPALRVLPADQGFGADHLAGAHVHLGLVIQDELPRRQSLANVLDIFMTVREPCRSWLGSKMLNAVPPASLAWYIACPAWRRSTSASTSSACG